MRYIQIQFTAGLSGQGLMLINPLGEAVEFRDLAGALLKLPAKVEYKVVDEKPPIPSWDVPDPAPQPDKQLQTARTAIGNALAILQPTLTDPSPNFSDAIEAAIDQLKSVP